MDEPQRQVLDMIEQARLRHSREQVKALDRNRTFYEMTQNMSAEEIDAFSHMIDVIMSSKNPLLSLNWLRGWLSSLLYTSHGVPPWGDLVDDEDAEILLAKGDSNDFTS